MKKAGWTIVLIVAGLVVVSIISAIFGGLLGLFALIPAVAELFLFGINWWKKKDGTKLKKALRRIGFVLIAWLTYAVTYGIVYFVYRLICKLF